MSGGKYNAACTFVRQTLDAGAVVLLVLDGSRGSGFSVQIEEKRLEQLLPDLAAMLRHVADHVERDYAAAKESDR